MQNKNYLIKKIIQNKKIYKIPDDLKKIGCENISDSDINKIIKYCKK